VKTNRGSATSIEPWACDVILAVTACFIFVARTVKDAVAAQIRRQAVAISRTLEVGLQACDVIFAVTSRFILETRAIKHAVAAHGNRQAVIVIVISHICTEEMGLRACSAFHYNDTARFILTTSTVEHGVATLDRRQAVTVPCALKLGFWAEERI
jgi:hypothetical protein